MSLSLLINGADYSRYVVPNVNVVYTDALNASKTLTFALYAADKNFTIVTGGESVRVIGSLGLIFTGYIVGTPSLEIVSTGHAGYNVVVKSEESIFDIANFGIQSPFVGQNAGDILKSLILLASPNTSLNLTKIASGPFVPYFAVQTNWTFTQAATALAAKVGFRWYVLDHIVYFVPQNDAPYGYSIDTTQPGFIITNLEFGASSAPIYNDVTVLGPNEPQTIIEEAYWGDGLTSSYTLTKPSFGSPFNQSVFDDYFQSSVLDSIRWVKRDPNNSFLYAARNFVVSGSSAALNQTVLYSTNTFELAGEMLFDHGIFTFNAISVGIVGGLYNSNTFTGPQCFAGFSLTGAATTTGIVGYINGQQVGTTLVTQNNHQYRLQTYISADEIHRYHDVYRSKSGQFGGDLLASDAYVTLVVLDTDLANPSAAPVQTVLYDQRVSNIPAFAYYAYINSQGMFTTISRGPVVSQLPSIRLRSTVSGRVTPSINLDPDTNICTVSVPDPPTPSEGITIHYRTAGAAQTRLVNNNSLTTNGRKYITLNVQSLARNYVDCESIGQSFLNDHIETPYEGSYLSPALTLTTLPQSGKYVTVNNPSITSLFSTIVRQVVITFTSVSSELATIQTTFGFAPLFASYATSNVKGTIAVTDFTQLPQFLQTLSSLHLLSVSATQLSVLASRNPLRFFEVRTTDSGWGQGGFVLQTNAAGFLVNRTSHSDTFYFRELDFGATPKYSKFSTLLLGNGYPLAPQAPSSASSIFVGSNIIYTIVLDSTVDVYGVEIRQTDNTTVVYQTLFTSNADLTFVVKNIANITSLTGYNFYTFNSHGDYSLPRVVDSSSATVGNPNPPTSLIFVATDYIRGGDGTIIAEATISWTASTTPNVTYLIRYVTHGNTNYSYLAVSSSSLATITGLALNTSYDVAVCAVGAFQQQSIFTSTLQITTAPSAAAPSNPSGLTAIPGFRVIALKWTPNVELDLAGYLVQFSTDNAIFTTIAKTYTSLFVDKGDSVRGELGVNTTYYYRIAAFNTNGQASSFTASANATTTQVGTTDIAADSITGNMIQANTITASKITSVNASAVNGVLIAGNIPGLDASKIVSGLFATGQIPNLDFSKIVSGTLWGQNITSTTIDGNHITTGTVTANQLAAISRFSISKSIQFTGNNSGLTWTGGYLIVPNNSNVNTLYTISAQSSPVSTPSGGNAKYIYFSASTSTTVLNVTSNVADGSIPTLPADAFVIAVWHGGADVTVFSGQTVIDGGHIQTNTITATNIAAGTITASRLVVTDTTNLCGNPSGEGGLNNDSWTGSISATVIDADPNMLLQTAALSGSPWSSGQLTSITDNTTDFTDPVGTNTATKLVCNGGTDPTLAQIVTTGSLAGQTFTISAWIRGTGATIGKSLALFIYSSSVNEVWAQDFVLTGAWQRVSTTYTFTTSVNTSAVYRIDPVNLPPFASGDTVYVWGPQMQTGSVLADYISNAATRVYTGNNALQAVDRDGYYGGFFNVTPGDVYRFYIEAYPSATAPPVGDFTIGLHFRTTPTTTAGETWTFTSYTSRSTQAWRALRGQVTVPAGYLFGQLWVQINGFNPTGTWYFRNVIVNKAASADLLVDGTITAAKIVSVNASSVTGTLATSNIPGLDVSKIISGIFGTTFIPGLDASKIISGVFGTSLIPGLDASKIVSGTLWGQDITTTTIDGAHITTGTVVANKLAAISRFSISKSITFTGDGSGLTWTAGYLILPNSSGTATMYTISAQSSVITTPASSNSKYIYFSASTSTTTLQATSDIADGSIPSLASDAFVVAIWHGGSDITVFSGQTVIDGGHIQTNTITANKISTVNASSVTGTLAVGNIPGLDVAQIISGTFGTSFIPGLDAAKIISGILNTSRIPNLDFSKIVSGTIWGQDITTTTIDGSHISTGSVVANKLAAISRFSISKSITFTGTGSGLTWTAGYIIVPDSSGTSTMYTISAQSSAVATPSASNAKYIYFSISTSTTALQVTGNVADGSVPSLASDAFVVAIWHGGADITVFSGQTVIDGGHIQASSITSDKINTGGITVGGGSNVPSVFNVQDGGSAVVGYIGTYSSVLTGGTTYGGWFKTLGVGGTKDVPNLYTDTSGNLFLIGGQIYNSDGVFKETFEYDITKTWNLRAGTVTGTSFPQDGKAGGIALKATTNYIWEAFPTNLPFDPNKLYRMRTRFRKTAGTSATACYVGVECYAADGVTAANSVGANATSSQHYVCASGYDPGVSSTWTEFTGFFKGNAAGDAVFNSPNSITGDPANPSQLQNTVRYMRPLFILNYSGGGDTWEIDVISIDIIPDNLDQIADSLLYQKSVLGNTLAPDIPYNGDFEQFASGQVVGDGWTKAFETTGTITDANYARSSSPYRGNFAQAVLSGDNVKGTSVACRPFGIKQFLQYQFQVRAKIDTRPTTSHGFIFRILWYNDDSDFSRAGAASFNDIIAGGAAAFAANNTYQAFTGTITAPASARFCRIALYNWGPLKGSNTATTITCDTTTVQLQTVNTLTTVSGSTLAPTTNSNTPSVIPEMTTSVTSRGGKVLLIFSGNISNDNVSGQKQGFFDFVRDSTAVSVGTLIQTFSDANLATLVNFSHIDAPAAGSHTYSVRWSTNGGGQTLTATSNLREFQVLELP